MTISEIKERTAQTSPYFFSRATLRFFGQTMRSFSVHKQEDGRYRISAPYGPTKPKGETVRYYNPTTNKLERS